MKQKLAIPTLVATLFFLNSLPVQASQSCHHAPSEIQFIDSELRSNDVYSQLKVIIELLHLQSPDESLVQIKQRLLNYSQFGVSQVLDFEGKTYVLQSFLRSKLEIRLQALNSQGQYKLVTMFQVNPDSLKWIQ